MTKTELERHFKWTLDIVLLAKQYLFDSKSLLLLDTAEKDMIIRRNKFMSRSHEALWTLAIVETHKLFGGKNDDYRLQKVINYLKENYRNSEWKNDITIEDIQALEAKLTELEVVQRVEQLQELRNQHYAHKQKSPNRHWSRIELYYEGAEFLLNTADDICKTINKKVFNNCIRNLQVDKTSVKSTIDNLVEYLRFKGQENLKRRIGM